VKADFILFTRSVTTLASAVMAPFCGITGIHQNLVKLIAQISGATLPLQNAVGAGKKRRGYTNVPEMWMSVQ
jgi:hypothetical protein